MAEPKLTLDESDTAYSCPNGCGTLVPVDMAAAVQAHFEARQNVEYLARRLADALERHSRHGMYVGDRELLLEARQMLKDKAS